ncbi:MAG: ABC transporter ATP-binding protein [Pseudomonadota bacterium]
MSAPVSVRHPVLSVRHLHYRAPGGQRLLEDVSLDVATGSVLAIAGPNGAGKTTLMNTMCGLLSPTNGEVLFAGQPLQALSPTERARSMAIVAQQLNIDPRLSLRDYVALGQLPIWTRHGAADHAAHLNDCLHISGLADLADKPVRQLSGGELQRGHIARALAQKPMLLFLDEPTNHLDPDAKGKILSIVCQLGITVVMVLHDLVMIPEFATHVALMRDARLMASGPVGDVQTPAAIKSVFGVDYRLFQGPDRTVPALDIRRTTATHGVQSS